MNSWEKNSISPEFHPATKPLTVEPVDSGIDNEVVLHDLRAPSGEAARRKEPGGKPERRKKKETTVLSFICRFPHSLHVFTVDLHNSRLSLAACGSEERRTTARGLEECKMLEIS